MGMENVTVTQVQKSWTRDTTVYMRFWSNQMWFLNKVEKYVSLILIELNSKVPLHSITPAQRPTDGIWLLLASYKAEQWQKKKLNTSTECAGERHLSQLGAFGLVLRGERAGGVRRTGCRRRRPSRLCSRGGEVARRRDSAGGIEWGTTDSSSRTTGSGEAGLRRRRRSRGIGHRPPPQRREERPWPWPWRRRGEVERLHLWFVLCGVRAVAGHGDGVSHSFFAWGVGYKKLRRRLGTDIFMWKISETVRI